MLLVDSHSWRNPFAARMSAAVPDDLALSATYFLETRTTFAVIYGCNKKQEDEIIESVRLAKNNLSHPLLIAGIFAGLERDRLVQRAEDLVDRFTLGADMLESKPWSPNWTSGSGKWQEYLSICLQSRSLADQMRAVKQQLAKLSDQLEELEDWVPRQGGEGRSCEERKAAQSRRKTSIIMKRRLREIIDEYDDKIDECMMMVGNMSIAMQTVHQSTSPAQLTCR